MQLYFVHYANGCCPFAVYAHQRFLLLATLLLFRPSFGSPLLLLVPSVRRWQSCSANMSTPRLSKSERKGKTAQLYAAAIMKYSLVTDPVTVDPDEIGPDRLNRSGSTPNLQVMCLASNDRRFKIYLAVKLCSSHMRQHSEDPRIVDCPHRFIYVCYGVFWQGLGVLFCGFANGTDLA